MDTIQELAKNLPAIPTKNLYINGEIIPYQIINNQLYVNLTKLCQVAGKQYKHWKQLQRTVDLLNILEQKDVYQNIDLIIRDQGKIEDRVTWGHIIICIDVAQWLSPNFRIQVIEWIYQYIDIGKIMESLNECIKRDPIKPTVGYIYCIKTPIGENIYKVGKTKRSKEELYQRYKTYYGNRFAIKLYQEVDNRHEAEKYILQQLNNYLIDDSEIAECELSIIQHYFNQI